MKKKIFSTLLLSCLVVFCGFALTACGNKYIVKRDYSVINMEVIRDNTGFEDYRSYDDGEMTDVFTASMACEDCTIKVQESEVYLIYDRQEETGFYATYKFTKYTKEEEYPAFNFSSLEVKYNNKTVDINTFESESEDYISILQLLTIMKLGDTSLQLVTQNKSLVAHFIILDSQTQDLIFMSVIYGY